MTDTRIPADHPAIPFMTTFPSFYVGQQVINRGNADEVLDFAMAYVSQHELWEWQKSVVELLVAAGVPAEVSPGDSPGADSYIYVGVKRLAGTPDEIYICAYAPMIPEVTTSDVVVFRDNGNDVDTVAQIEAATKLRFAAAIEEAYTIESGKI